MIYGQTSILFSYAFFRTRVSVGFIAIVYSDGFKCSTSTFNADLGLKGIRCEAKQNTN